MAPPHETTAFERVVVSHLDAAYNLARWLVRNDTDAQDVVQDACVRALRGFADFRGGDARAWLLAIVRNTAYTRLKRRNEPVEFDDDLPAGGDWQAPGPPELLLRDADAQRVRAAIESLPVELRTAIVLREMEGMSYKQIAAVTSVPIGTVMSRLSRGRERLAGLLAEPREIGGRK